MTKGKRRFVAHRDWLMNWAGYFYCLNSGELEIFVDRYSEDFLVSWYRKGPNRECNMQRVADADAEFLVALSREEAIEALVSLGVLSPEMAAHA